MIFAQTKATVDRLCSTLGRHDIRADGIHGDKSQAVREAVLRKFRMGRVSVLVATDIAARGLDVDDISYVINYDFPNDCEDYIHR